MDNNTLIETQPVIEQPKVPFETPVLPENPVVTEANEAKSDNQSTEKSSPTEAVANIPNEVVAVEVSTEIPKPSAGFPIQSEGKGASRIVVEKIIGKIANL